MVNFAMWSVMWTHCCSPSMDQSIWIYVCICVCEWERCWLDGPIKKQCLRLQWRHGWDTIWHWQGAAAERSVYDCPQQCCLPQLCEVLWWQEVLNYLHLDLQSWTSVPSVWTAWMRRAKGILSVCKSPCEYCLVFCFSLNDASVFCQRSSCSGPPCVPLISARWQRTWSCTAPKSFPSSPSPMPTGELWVFVLLEPWSGQWSQTRTTVEQLKRGWPSSHPDVFGHSGVWQMGRVPSVCVRALNCNKKKMVIWSSMRQTPMKTFPDSHQCVNETVPKLNMLPTGVLTIQTQSVCRLSS